jgi:anti-anti-sigma factor
MSDTIKTGNLEVRLVRSNGDLIVEWLGEADERDPSRTLRPFLDDALRAALDGHRRLVLDLTQLEFMNSSAIGLVTHFAKSGDESGSLVEVRFDTRKAWQVLSKRCTVTIFARSPNVTVVDLRDGQWRQ